MNESSYAPALEMTLRDYLRVLFRHKGILVLTVLVTMVVLFLGMTLRTPMYEASVKMLVRGEKQVEASYYKELLSSRQMQASLTQAEIVTSDPILQRAVDVLRLYQKPLDYEARFASPLKRKLIHMEAKAAAARMERLPVLEQRLVSYRRAMDELRSNIKVEPVRDTNVFVIKVRDYDRLGAATIANVLSRSYVIFDLEQQLAELQLKYGPKHPVLLQLHDNIKSMTENLSGGPLTNAEAIGPASVKIIEQASIPLRPVNRPKNLIFVIGFLTSLFVGMVLAFIFEYMDQTIKSPRDVEGVLAVPFFGSIPPLKGRKHLFANGELHKRIPQPYIKSYYSLIDQIHLLGMNNSLKSLLLVSPEASDGTALITANLAYHLAQHAGKNVLVIDANYRNPSLHKIFEIQSKEGLVDALMSKVDFAKVVHGVRQGLFVVPAGESEINPLLLLDSPKMRQLLENVKNQYDFILIACAELKSYKDGCILASMVDKTLFVVSESETRKQVALNSIAALKERHVPILGAILNKRTYPIPKFVYERV